MPKISARLLGVVLASCLTFLRVGSSDDSLHRVSGAGKGGPRFVSPIGNITVAHWREARLICSVENLGSSKVAWIHKRPDGGRIVMTYGSQAVTKNSRVSSQHEGQDWILSILNVTKEYKGEYMCQINTSPRITQSVYLSVVIPPDINDKTSSSQVIVDKGHNATLICDARGDPTPKIKWKRENQKDDRDQNSKKGIKKFDFPPRKRLFLQEVTREMAGAYLCMANNGIPPIMSKRMVLQVNFSPKIEKEDMEKSQGAVMNADIILTCKFKAMPQANVTWYRSKNLLITRNRYSLLNPTMDLHKGIDPASWTATLALRLEKREHFGSYSCEVTNDFGTDSYSFNVFEVTTTSTTTSTTTVKPTTSTASSNLYRNNPRRGYRKPTQPPIYSTYNYPETTTGVNRNLFSRDSFDVRSGSRKNTQRQTQIEPDSFSGSSSGRGWSIVHRSLPEEILPATLSIIISISLYIRDAYRSL